MKPSEKWNDDISKMADFRNAYVAAVNATKRGGDGFIPKLVPNVSATEWNSLRQKVSVAAGAASSSYQRAGGATLAIRNAAWVMPSVNPMTNWAMSLDDPLSLPPETVINSVETSIGIATTNRDEAARRERGLTGLIAAFLRWPQDLREAVGPSRAQRRAAGVIGVFGQLVVAAVGGALAVGLAAGAVALWHLLF